MSTTLLTLAQACALPKADALAYLDARIAKGFKNDAKAALWTRARESLVAGQTPDTKPQIAKIVEAAKAAKAAAPAKPKAVITPVVKVPNQPKAGAFTRTHEVVEAKSAVGHLHNRMCAVEHALASMARSQQSMLESINSIARRLG